MTFYRFEVDIWVKLTDSSPYGQWSDLLTAYGLAYSSYTDIFGAAWANGVYIEGELPQAPAYALVDTSAPFRVSLKLRQRIP